MPYSGNKKSEYHSHHGYWSCSMSNRPELRLEERLRGVNHSQRKPTPTLSRKPSNDSNVGMLTHSATPRRGNGQAADDFP